MPTNTKEPLVKRVIATEGQHIKIDFDQWKIWIDGELLQEDYINYLDGVPMSHFNLPTTEGVWEGTVPEGKIFVMGDNRNNSQDSRSLGYIDERWLVGRVVTRLAPLDRFGKVD
jgi:signal peptidase I